MRHAYEWIQQWMPVYYEGRGYLVLPLVGVGLVVAHWLVPPGNERAGAALRAVRLALGALLVATALFSVAVYNNFFNYHYGSYLNAYEFFHYYLGSKYAPEIGYFDMYGAALAADAETGRVYWPADGAITDLATNRPVPVERLERDARRYRSLFSAERWRAWSADVFWFKQHMGSAAWNRILHDHGYNATPVFTAIVGRALSNRVPTSSERGMNALALLDAALLAGAIAAVAWTFGLWPALSMVVFLASSYLMAHVHMKGAFLRTDFVVALVFAVCLLRRGRHGWAGALVGYATMSRLFPVVFLFGPGVRLLADLRRRRLDAGRLRFFAGFAVATATLFAISVADGGVGRWILFAKKISVHRAVYHPWNVGLPSVVAGEFDGAGARLPEGAVERERPWITLIQIAAIVLAAWAARGLDDHRALAFGFVPLFFLVAPTYYYYIVLLLPFLFFAARLRSAAGAIGVAYLFLFGLAGHLFYERWEQHFTTYWGNSLMALVLALYMLALAILESGRTQGATSTPRPASPTG